MSRLLLSARCLLFVALTATAVSLPAQPPAKQTSRPPTAAVPAAKTDLKVHNLSLADFAHFLSQKYQIPVQLDDAGLKRARVTSTAQVSADVTGVPLGKALDRTLAPVKLAPLVFNGIVLITDRRPPGEPEFRPRPIRIIQRVQNPFVAGQNQPDDGWKTQVTVELLFVKKVCAPTKEQLRSIKHDLTECLERAATGVAEASCDTVPNELAECVSKHLSPEQAEHYRRELVKRRANEREACVWTFVTFLDQDLALTETQRRVIVATLLPKWQSPWSQLIELTVRNGTREVPPIPDNLIVPLLDREQTKRWEALPRNRDPNPRFQAERMGAVGTPIDEVDVGD